MRAAANRRNHVPTPTKVMASPFCPTTTFYGSAALPFVIPSEAEGSAVYRTRLGNIFRGMRMGLTKTLIYRSFQRYQAGFGA
jgi:hypothetical protein